MSDEGGENRQGWGNFWGIVLWFARAGTKGGSPPNADRYPHSPVAMTELVGVGVLGVGVLQGAARQVVASGAVGDYEVGLFGALKGDVRGVAGNFGIVAERVAWDIGAERGDVTDFAFGIVADD